MRAFRRRAPGVLRRTCVFGALALCLSSAATAQQFDQAIVFGDSSVDSGAYRGLPSPRGTVDFNALWAAAVAAQAGKPTSSPGLMNSEALAAFFGLTATPAAQTGLNDDIPGVPGGTNFATSGARTALDNTQGSGLFNAAVPMTKQIDNYLAAVGGRANPNALYLISGGENDISFALDQDRTDSPKFAVGSAEADNYLTEQAGKLVSSIAKLKAAGARYIIVPNLVFSFPRGDGALATAERADRVLFNQTLWSGLAAAGVNFIPADFNAVRQAIFDDFNSGKKTFGFETIGTGANQTTCTRPKDSNGQTVPNLDASALLCSKEPGAPSQYANVPNPDQTRLFADAAGHLSTAGQQIKADYFYSLVIAPSQVSLLPETAVKARTRLVSNIQTQIDASSRQPRGANGLNAWVTGDVSHLATESFHGFPDSSSTPQTLAAGLGAHLPGGVLVGGAISVNHQKPDFSGGRGSFSQDEFAGSAYAAFLGSSFWGTVVGTYGALDYDVNRIVPIGITLQSNSGQTSGHNISVAAQAGFDFRAGALKHGPVAGITWQRVDVNGFTETGSFTSLGFGDQTRDSAVTALGYRASLDLGLFRPFAQFVWNHELAATGRDVTTSLTTTEAPSYRLPAMEFGRDWGTATIGTNIQLAPGVSALAAFSTEFGQDNAVSYGAQIGLNVAF